MGKVNKQTKKGNAQLSKMQKNLRQIGTTNLRQVAAGMGLAFGVQQIGRLQQAGAASKAVEDSFRRLNENADQLMGTLRQSSQGLLDDTTLQSIANKLQAVGMNGEKMSQVLDLGMKLAAQSGRSYIDVVNQLSQALLSGETESFKTLGVVIDTRAEMEKFATQNDRTVESLSKMEEAQIKVNAALRVGQERFGEADVSAMTTEVNRAATDVENAKDRLGRAFDDILGGAAVGLVATADAVAELNKNMSEAERQFEAGIDPVEKSQEAYAELAAAMEEYHKALDVVLRRQRASEEGAKNLWRTLGGGEGVVEALNRSLDDMGNLLSETAGGLRDAAAAAAATQWITTYAKDSGEFAGNLSRMNKLIDEETKLTAQLAHSWDSVADARLGAVIAEQEAMIASGAVSSGDVTELHADRQRKRSADFVASTKAMIAANLEMVRSARSSGGGRQREIAPEFEDLSQRGMEIAGIYSSMLEGRERVAEEARLASLQADALATQEIARLQEVKAARVASGAEVDEVAFQRMIRQTHDLAQAKRDQAKASVEAYDAEQRAAAEENLVRLDSMLLAEGKEAEAEALALAQQAWADYGRTIANVGTGMADAASQIQGLQSAFGGSEVFSQQAMVAISKLEQVAAGTGAIVESTAKGSKEVAGAVGNTLSSLGGLAGALVGEVGKAAAIMAALEGAAAIASAAYYDYRGAAMHGAAAAVYTGVATAAGAGAFGKRGRGKSNVATSLGTSSPAAATSQGTVTYVVNMGDNNVYAEDGPQVGLRLAEHLHAARFSGIPAAG